MNGKTPTRKIGAGALAGALSVILVWVAGLTGLEVPPEIASAVTTVMTFAVGWFVSEPEV